ncbi:MAG: tRNA (N(6)-L-threonylcarbamoyladenosine(37)-C(2))-methylthiotransferase MtaB [Bacteroidota bacterium]
MRDFKTFSFHTLGCKLNFSESSTLAKDFISNGYGRVDLENGPDVLVLNTCSVTDEADQKCRYVVRKAKRANPNVFIAVIGCYAQLKPEEIARIDGVNVVLGANEKFNLLKFIQEAESENVLVSAGDIKDVKEFIPSFSSGDRTRTFLKVQDGCNYFCSFCTIPLARGRSRSSNVAQTVIEARKAIKEGAKEIVLTGVNIGDFGTAYGETFFDLIRELDSLDGVERYRISSIEPNLLSDEIIDFVANSKRFMPHFHVPLQSGSDKVLKEMRRRYRTDLYRARMEKIREVMPQAAIGIDVIVGFPGETDELFMETVEFLKEIDFTYLHVFTYSERANTTAVRKEDVVPMEKRNERNKTLRLLSAKKREAFDSRFKGIEMPVLWESVDEDNCISGFTPNYIKVKRGASDFVSNQINWVEL